MSRRQLAQHVHEDDTLGLKARGHAGGLRVREFVGDELQGVAHCHEYLLEQAANSFHGVGIVGRRARRARQPLGRSRDAGDVVLAERSQMAQDHPRPGREVRRRIDQHEAAGRAIVGVGIEDERLRRGHGQACRSRSAPARDRLRRSRRACCVSADRRGPDRADVRPSRRRWPTHAGAVGSTRPRARLRG